MFDLLLGIDFVVFAQILDDLNIQTVFHNEVSLPRSFCIVSVFIHRLQYRQIVFASALIVVFTEGRSRMYDSCTVFRADVIHAGHEKCLFVCLAERHKLFVFNVFQVFALHFFYDFVFVVCKHLISQILTDPEEIAILFAADDSALDVINFRTYGQRHVGCQRPGRCRPCQEVFIVCILALELHGQRVDLDILVALCDFVGSQSRFASRTIRQDFVSLVNESGLKEFVDDPPASLDVVVVECDVRIVQVAQISHSFTHLLPKAFVCKY